MAPRSAFFQAENPLLLPWQPHALRNDSQISSDAAAGDRLVGAPIIFLHDTITTGRRSFTGDIYDFLEALA